MLSMEDFLNKVVICGLDGDEDLEFFRFQEEHNWQTFYVIMALLLYDDKSDEYDICKSCKNWKNRKIFWLLSDDLISYRVTTNITNKMMEISKKLMRKGDFDWSLDYRFVCNGMKLFYGASLYVHAKDDPKHKDPLIVALLLFLMITPRDKALSNVVTIVDNILQNYTGGLKPNSKEWISSWSSQHIKFSDDKTLSSNIKPVDNFVAEKVKKSSKARKLAKEEHGDDDMFLV